MQGCMVLAESSLRKMHGLCSGCACWWHLTVQGYFLALQSWNMMKKNTQRRNVVQHQNLPWLHKFVGDPNEALCSLSESKSIDLPSISGQGKSALPLIFIQHFMNGPNTLKGCDKSNGWRKSSNSVLEINSPYSSVPEWPSPMFCEQESLQVSCAKQLMDVELGTQNVHLRGSEKEKRTNSFDAGRGGTAIVAENVSKVKVKWSRLSRGCLRPVGSGTFVLEFHFLFGQYTGPLRTCFILVNSNK